MSLKDFLDELGQIGRVVQPLLRKLSRDSNPAWVPEQESCRPVLQTDLQLEGDKNMNRGYVATLATILAKASAIGSMAQVQETVFDLTTQQKFLSCFAQPGRLIGGVSR